MLETLLTILKWDLYVYAISLEEDGDILLEAWDEDIPDTLISINKDGGVNWSNSIAHGNNLDELKRLLEQES